MSTTTKVFIGLALAAFVSRIVPHYPNFTAMGALAFYGAWSTRKLVPSLAVMVLVMMLSDLFINNVLYPADGFVWMYAGSIWTYAGFAAYALVGRFSGKRAMAGLGLVAGSLLFFALSNFGVFMSPFSMFPKTVDGLLATYAAAIPFYAPELLGTALVSGLAYGAHQWVARTATA